MKKVGSILDFADGAANERINYELAKIVENIQNPNTDEKPRKLTIEVTLTPTNGRRSVSMKTVVKKSLRPTSAVATQMVFQNLDGELKTFEMTGIPDGQVDLFGEVHEQKYFSVKKHIDMEVKEDDE